MRTFAKPFVITVASSLGASCGHTYYNPPPPPSWKLVIDSGHCATTANRRTDPPDDYACPAGLADGEYIVTTDGTKCYAETAKEVDGGRPVTEVVCPTK